MQPGIPSRIILGPWLDLSRYVRGQILPPPVTRQRTPHAIAAAQATLERYGCDLRGCSVINLHTAHLPLAVERLFELVLNWQGWPCSAFFAHLSSTQVGEGRFAYRFYGLLPIVLMRLSVVQAPEAIIYRITHGIGKGGYHSFLLHPRSAQTSMLSICTTFPPTCCFIEGLHDQMNLEIYLQLSRS